MSSEGAGREGVKRERERVMEMMEGGTVPGEDGGRAGGGGRGVGMDGCVTGSLICGL